MSRPSAFFTASLYPVCYIISCGACQSPPLPPYEIFVKLKIFQPISHFLFFPVDSHDGMHYNVGNWQKQGKQRLNGKRRNHKMKYGRTFNFSAGPAMMPEPVLEEIRDEMMNYRGSGMCVMEMSHRSKVFQQIADEAEADLRKLMHIPDNYKVLFIQGGGTVQFAMVAMNLMKNGKACYVETGAWSKKAIAEAKKFGEVDVIASSKDKNFSYIPDCSDLDIPDDCDYVYICENETINGTTWNKLPNTKGHVLVSDQSSMFLSRPCNVSDYGLIWAGVQKNVGPAGMAVVIIREDLIRDDLDPKTPIYLMYKTHADNGSMYNTPNCWAIYCCGKVFKYLLNMGGLEEMEKRNIEKAKVLYDFLDSSKLFKGAVVPQDRSLMNVPFVTGDKDLDAAVVAASKEAGFDNLKGHKSVGGLRASIYNAMPKEGVEALVEFLTKFEAEHQA
jgi:phosphoserine transaminase